MAIYPLPYLEPAVDGPGLISALEEEVLPVRLRHDEVTRLALGRIRRDLQGRPKHRSVLVAHTFVAGGESSESERELTVGNVDRVSVEAFAGFDYVALGHLHGSQQLDGPRLAYSGTPCPIPSPSSTTPSRCGLWSSTRQASQRLSLCRCGWADRSAPLKEASTSSAVIRSLSRPSKHGCG